MSSTLPVPCPQFLESLFFGDKKFRDQVMIEAGECLLREFIRGKHRQVFLILCERAWHDYEKKYFLD